jgi:hypothetical protein
VRVREALEAVAKVVLDLTLAIRGASAITLIAAVLVLAGALATGHRHRVYDAVVLKMLGATRWRLLAAYALEYLLIGLATAVRRRRGGLARRLLVMTEVMNLSSLAAAGRRSPRRSARRIDHRVRPDRHVFGARPEARAGSAPPCSKIRRIRQSLRQSAARLARRAIPASHSHLGRPDGICPY